MADLTPDSSETPIGKSQETDNMTAEDSIDVRDGAWRTALYRAAEEGKVQSVSDLLQRGARVDARAKKRFTPLHAAARFGRIEVMQALMKGGAGVNKQTIRSMTPLMIACRYSQDEAALLLLKVGCDITLGDMFGRSALHWSIKMNRRAVFDELILSDANSSIVDRFNKSPILQAAKSNRPLILTRLLSLHADFNTADKFHREPIHIAALLGNNECIKVFHKHNAGLINKPSSFNGSTPLVFAISGRKPETVKLLLKLGATPNAPNDDVGGIPIVALVTSRPNWGNNKQAQAEMELKMLLILLQANVDAEIVFHSPVWLSDLAAAPVNSMEMCVCAQRYDLAEVLARAGVQPGHCLRQILATKTSQLSPTFSRNIQHLDSFRRFFASPRPLKELARRSYRRSLVSYSTPHVLFEEKIENLAPGLRSYLMYNDLRGWVGEDDIENDDESDEDDDKLSQDESDLSDTEEEMEPSVFDSDLYGDRNPYDSS